jgi:hypothetical protein
MAAARQFSTHGATITNATVKANRETSHVGKYSLRFPAQGKFMFLCKLQPVLLNTGPIRMAVRSKA